MRGAGLYISIPFCAQKCTYCNFRSDVYQRSLRKAYVKALGDEIAGAPILETDTLYLGGGSPSMLDAEEFAAITSHLPHSTWEEATIEVAPGEVQPERIKAWTAGGINRASLGVQSFDREVARAAGRRHDSAMVAEDVRTLRNAGIVNISIDLIAGLAFQTTETWNRSLECIERLDADHVSVYMLEADDDSRLGREIRTGGSRYGAEHIPGDTQIVDLYGAAVRRLRAMGFERYEISNFAREGRRGSHNRKYWTMQPYIGLGSDAHSFDGQNRWANVRTAPEYVHRSEKGVSAQEGIEKLDRQRLFEDRLLTGIRMVEGVALTRDEWNGLAPAAGPLEERGWVERIDQALRLTDEGMLFADTVVAELLPLSPGTSLIEESLYVL